MSAVEEILADLPIGQLASQLGVDEATAESAARQAIPALLGGLQANAEDPAGAASLAGALGDHSGDLLDGGVDLGQVDTGDGEKIVSNIFGPNSDQVAQTLGGALGGSQAGGQGDLMKRLLPILAPIVLAYLSKKVAGGKYGDLLGPLIAGAAGGAGANVLTDILGKMLGRGGAAANQPASAPDPEPTAEPAESSTSPRSSTSSPGCSAAGAADAGSDRFPARRPARVALYPLSCRCTQVTSWVQCGFPTYTWETDTPAGASGAGLR